MGKVYCSVCRKRCKGDVLKVDDQFVHNKCFQCTKCRKNLQQGGFFVRDNRFYCPDDYQAEFGVKCEVCQAFVEGEVVTVLGRTFHTRCFRCNTCSRLFTAGERTTIFDGLYYCTSCATNCNKDLNFSRNHTGQQNTAAFSPLSPPGPTDGRRASLDVPTAPRLPTDNRTRTLPPTPAVTSTGIVNSTPGPQLSSSRASSYVPVDGQLTVQINENGFYSPGTDTDLEKAKSLVAASSVGPAGDPGTLDTMISSTTPGRTFSGTSYLYSGSVRRICPPGVDYGRHYPVSYLQLAEQGFTAIMSSDEVTSPVGSRESRQRMRSLTRAGYSCLDHVSRRDTPTSISGSAHRIQSAHQGLMNGAVDQPDNYASPHVNGGFRPELSKSHTIHTGSSFAAAVGCHTPISFLGRPKRDYYIRRRELSPGSSSLGAVGFAGYQSNRPYRTAHSTMPPGIPASRGAQERFPYQSTPNVTSKRGMTALAESMVQSRRRPDRSVSPECAYEYWLEARRMAAYPAARVPEQNAVPAIERADFPAPPSPAVIMMDKKREKRHTEGWSATATMESTASGDGTLSITDQVRPDSRSGTLELSSRASTRIGQIDHEIETLRRLGESSGITAALIQELEANKSMHARFSELDPVSASRSPSANTEPPYKTRYERHTVSSPSRDTRRDRRPGHNLSSRMDYSSTGGRSGTMGSVPSTDSTSISIRDSSQSESLKTPRPGYTSGMLCYRAVSLPRPDPALSETVNGQIIAGQHSSPPLTTVSGIQSATHRSSGLLSHNLQPGERLMYAAGPPDMMDRTITTDESLHTTLAGIDSQQLPMDGIGSLATSALSMDRFTSGSGDETGTTLGPDMAYYIKSRTALGLPHSITGLRPVGAILQQQQRYRSLVNRPHHSATRVRSPSPLTSSLLGHRGYMIDEDMYPSVQSWLRPTSAPGQKLVKSFKIYPYAQLKGSAADALKGVDRMRLENHLDPIEFETLFQMKMVAFLRLPEWKRNDLKKKLDLFADDLFVRPPEEGKHLQ